MPKHIALILAQPPGYSETFFRSKIKGLQAAGFTVSLYVQRTFTAFNDCRVWVMPKVHRNPSRQVCAMVLVFLGLLPYLQRVLRFIQLERASGRKGSQLIKNIYTNAALLKSDADWLHFGFATLALQREQVAKAIGAKMAVSLRGFDADVYPLKHSDCYRLVWKQVDKVHVISNYILQRSYALGLMAGTPYAVITPAVKTVAEKAYNRKDKTAIQLLSIGRLHWIKDYPSILEALAILKQQGISIKYSIIGIGEELEPLRFAIHQLGLKQEVKLVGKLAHETVFEYLQQTDIYIQYSMSEGFCNAVLEAQASGCLCVVSDGGGLPENVLHGKTGWVVPKLQPKALAATLLAVINLPKVEQQGYRERAVARVKAEFNLEQQAEQFVEFYN